jgi:GT2 family glycosyltransferase
MRSRNQARFGASDHVRRNTQVAAGLQLEEPSISGWIDHASWLSDDVLLLVGWFHADADPLQASLVLDGEAMALETRCISYSRHDLTEADSFAGKVLTVRFPEPEKARGPLGSVVVHTADANLALGPLELSHAMNDLESLVHTSLVWWDSDARSEVMTFLVSALTAHGDTTNILRLSKNLCTVRDVLREREPTCTISPDNPQGLSIDAILAIDEKSFYIKGWMRDEESRITNLTAISPEGSRVELLEESFRYPRPDVEQYYGLLSEEQLLQKTGFISCFEVEEPSCLPAGWVVEMRNAAGVAVENNAPKVVRDTVTVRNTVLGDLIYERLPNDYLLANYVFPAVNRLQQKIQEMAEVENVLHYGRTSECPDVSVIVPLYQRVDFLEQQLTQFVHDREMREVELIYVLDSPELADELTEAAAQLFRLYRVPFSVAMLRRNVGFSAVNNVGASLARGRLLLLLNSDVLPDKPGWLSKMSSFYDSTPEIGALGPKLLYEDDSLQHAGMYFYRPGGSSLWENMHYLKGMHRNLEGANLRRPVPAVSGACLMIARDLYNRLGGLQGEYVQGDYEDSDLCLRLMEEGYENWYLPDAELYHLEGQSYPLALRQLNTRYNTWLQTRRWNEHIESVMARYASPIHDGVREGYPSAAQEATPEQGRAQIPPGAAPAVKEQGDMSKHSSPGSSKVGSNGPVKSKY